jgi:hypothetical protein
VTLTIDRLVIRGKIPRKLNFDSTLVKRVSAEQLPIECARQLTGPWPVQAQVVRIRMLRVHVTIQAAKATADTFAAAWTAAFKRELFAALAHPDGAEIVRFKSRAEYLASAVRDLLAGVDSQRWVYNEFEISPGTGAAGASFDLLQRNPSEIVPTLLILEDWGLLDRLLLAWDSQTLERLFIALESTNGAKDENLSVEDLIGVATLLLGHRPLLIGIKSARATRSGEQSLALKLFLSPARKVDWHSTGRLSPLTIFRALRVFGTLLDLHQSVAAARRRFQSPINASTGIMLSSPDPLGRVPADGTLTDQTPCRELMEQFGSVENGENRHNLLIALWNASDTNLTAFVDLLGELTSVFSSDTHRHQITQLWNIIAAGSSERRSAFTELLGELTSAISFDNHREQITRFWDIVLGGSGERRTEFATLFEELSSATKFANRQSHARNIKWVSTDCAGLFLLIKVIERLGWAERLGRLSFDSASGPRLLTYVLAGIGLATLGRFEEVLAYLDPGLALFSGWIEASDLGGLHRFFALEPARTRRDILVELLGNAVTEDASTNWQACFDLLANYLAQEFARRIRGFGRSSRSFIVKNFIALPGRIRIEETRLLVVFSSSPLNAVVHMSRLDDPVEEVAWLGRRGIEFEPYGL